MKLYNSLTKQTQTTSPIQDNTYRVYSCGPTVYNHLHIGNLASFVYADTLRRVLNLEHPVRHVMNVTDIDDKTIRDSKLEFPGLEPAEALKRLTSRYTDIFLKDMELIGNDMSAVTLIKATDCIEGMQGLIRELLDAGIAYLTEHGVYFSIQRYQKLGKTYGQLSVINPEQSQSRITSDEYDADNAADFALWKAAEAGEPSWDFEIDGVDMRGRPGWHIECSVMSRQGLGQPFDIHTGGIDLKFPHHENEIAQSTATTDQGYAGLFFHNEHLLVDGSKMSKSKHNFYTLEDVASKGYDALALRLLVLQSHYQSQLDFSWKSLSDASLRLNTLRALSALRFQATEDAPEAQPQLATIREDIKSLLEDNLATPSVIAKLNELDPLLSTGVNSSDVAALEQLISFLDTTLGLGLTAVANITPEQMQLLTARQAARDNKDWETSDQLRAELQAQHLLVKDLPTRQLWYWAI